MQSNQDRTAILTDMARAVDGDPVDLGTGLYISEETDFFFPDIIPIALTRTYRTQDTGLRPFGIGASHPYAMYLLRDDQCTAIRLILPNGSPVHYTRMSGTNCLDATLHHNTSPTPFYNSTVAWNEKAQQWVLYRRDGTIYRFNMFMALAEVEDQQGNRMTIGLDASNRPISLTSPCGLWLRFSYDTANRTTAVEDFLGRRAIYEYDIQGRLLRVSYPSGRVSVYSYDTASRMVTIGDEQGTIWSNHYDEAGRVRAQTYPDGTSFQFRYVVTDSGRIRQTLVKDRSGKLRVVTFNDAGYTVADVPNAEMSHDQTTTFDWEPGTNSLRGINSSVSSSAGPENLSRKDMNIIPGQDSSGEGVGGRPGITNSVPGDLTDPALHGLVATCRPAPLLVTVSAPKAMDREDVGKIWSDLLRDEHYETLKYLNETTGEPTEAGLTADNSIVIQEGRTGYLGGLFGYSRGGGWKVEGRLEAEVPIQGGIWQLYSKRTTHWTPSFMRLWEAKPKEGAEWEFHLIRRNPIDRKEIQEMKVITIPLSDLLPSAEPPRGKLRYDSTRGTAIIEVSRLRQMMVVDVPMSPFFQYVKQREIPVAEAGRSAPARRNPAISNLELFKLAGLDVLSKAIQQSVSQAFAQLHSEIPPEHYSFLSHALTEAFAQKKMEDRVTKYLDEHLAKESTDQALRWLKSELGKKFSKLEEAAATPEARQRMKQYVAQLQKSPPQPSRLQLMQRLEVVTHASDLLVGIAEATGVSMGQAVDAIQGKDGQQAVDRRQHIQSRHAQIKQAAYQQALFSQLYIYQTLHDEEIGRYIQFAESKAGRDYHTVVSQALILAVVQGGEEFTTKATNARKQGDKRSI